MIEVGGKDEMEMVVFEAGFSSGFIRMM